MRCSKLFIFLLSLVFISSCFCFTENKSGHDDKINSLIGSDISFIDTLLDYREKEHPDIILICSVYDCGSCLNSAFKELKILDGFLYPSSVQVVAVLSDPTPLQTRYEYYDYIVYDIDDTIRRHLKYIPTPVFVVFDDTRQVLYLHRPTAEDEPESVANLLRKQLLEKVLRVPLFQTDTSVRNDRTRN